MEPSAPPLYPSLDFGYPTVQVDSKAAHSEKMDPSQIDSKLNPTTSIPKNLKKTLKVRLTTLILGFLVVLLVGYSFGFLCQQNVHIHRKVMVEFDRLKNSSELAFSSWIDSVRTRIEYPKTRALPDPITNSGIRNFEYKAPDCLQISQKLEFISNMASEAWDTYTSNAWGYDSVKPLTGQPVGAWNSGHTILASMSTLWVMGLKEEFYRAKDWIMKDLKFHQINDDVNVFEVAVSDYVGGLLSCYALTGDKDFVIIAQEIARALEPAYDTPTGLSYKSINPYTSQTKWTRVTPSDIGGPLLEYTYLSKLIPNDPIPNNRAQIIWNFIQDVEKPEGLFQWTYDVKQGHWTDDVATTSSVSNELYYNLVKSYLQLGSGKSHQEAIQLYESLVDALEHNGLVTSRFSSHTRKSLFNHHVKSKQTEDDVEQSSCLLGAMLSLGAHVMNRTYHEEGCKRVKAARHMMLAKEITEMCHKKAIGSLSGLIPWKWFQAGNGRENQRLNETVRNKYEFSSQLAESYFILWRLTHEQKYRDYAWQMVLSIHRHCRTGSGGYTTIENVNQVPTASTNSQPPHFLSATLKYLYLTFTPDSVLPLDQWVFNSAGHPLPICGTSDAYFSCKRNS